MEIASLKALAHATPFVPFDIVLRGGHRLQVFRPFQMMINPQNTLLIYSNDNGSGRFERYDVALVDHWEVAQMVRAS